MGEIVAVSSVVYNMAGPEEDRPQYLKNLVVRYALSSYAKKSVSDTIVNGYLKGPAMKLKAFYRWAKRGTNYDQIGIPSAALKVSGTLNPNVIEPFIPHGGAETVWGQTARVGTADLIYWAERYILDNQPDDYDAAWTFTFDSATNEITIDFPVGPSATFVIAGFDANADYVYCYYSITNTTLTTADDVQGLQLYIYKLGSGTADLDAVVLATASYDEFLPFLPIRLDNHYLSETFPTAWNQVSKAFKKATDGSVDDLVDSIDDNPDIGDIDHAYVVFGVSLNVVENACKKYLYNFFSILQSNQIGGVTAYDSWKADMEAQTAIADDWRDWINGGLVGMEPPRPRFPVPPANQIRIAGTGPVNSKFDTRLEWALIDNGTGVGHGMIGAKKGDLWFEVLAGETIHNYTIKRDGGDVTWRDKPVTYDKIRLYWQNEDESYVYLDILGALHRNCVYGAQAVIIKAGEALADPDESGFIIPLHFATWNGMSIVDTTQMSTACIFIVFNCFEIHKTHWYDSGLFKLFLVVVIAILATLFTGGGGFGVLGANLAVGTSLGFTGLTAAIVGSVANALAAMVLSTIIEKFTSNLGILGPIIGTLLMFLVGSVASSFSSGSAAINWGDLLKPENLLKLTDSLGQSISKGINQDTMDLQKDFTDFQKNAGRESDNIQQAYFSEFGSGNGRVDPLMFTDSSSAVLAESSDTFLTRTLMTGSDVAGMSTDLLDNFSDYSLTLPNAFT